MFKNFLSADLVLTNGKIITVDAQEKIVQAVAAKGDKILAIGSSEEIKAFVDNRTNVIDLKGRRN